MTLILGVIFDKFTFEHLRSFSSSVALMIGLLRKFFFKVFGISQSCRNVLIFLFFCVWSITHLFGVLQYILSSNDG